MSLDTLISGDTLTEIADAIREVNGGTDTYTPTAMPDAIRTLGSVQSTVDAETGEWVRPDGWPDLDSLDLTDADAIFYTVDCTAAISLNAIDSDAGDGFGMAAYTTAGTWQLDRGTVTDGEYVVTETVGTAESGTALYDYLPTDEGDYVVYRATATEGNITQIRYSGPYVQTDTSSRGSVKIIPVLEVRGRLPYLSGMNWNSDNILAYATRYTEYVNIEMSDEAAVESMAYAFYCAYNLVSINLSGTDLSSCKSFANAFYNCYNLQALDLSGLDLSACTTMENAFRGCYNVKSIKLPDDLSACTTMENTFRGCTNLLTLELPSNLSACTTLAYAFYICYNLPSLELPDNLGACTTLTYAFYNCYTLDNLDLSSLDLSACTTLAYAFCNCSGLQSISLPSNLSACTSLSNAFYNCYTLQSLDLSGTDLSACETLAYAFRGCYRLQSLKLPGDLSACTSLAYMLYNCSAMLNVELPSDLSACKTLEYAFYNCSSLHEIILPSTLGSCTTLTSAFRSCLSLYNIELPGDLSVCTAMGSAFYDCGTLQVLSGITLWPAMDLEPGFTSSSLYTATSLNTIIAALPELDGGVSYTLTIGESNIAKLTDEEFAVGTDKGWTIE